MTGEVRLLAMPGKAPDVHVRHMRSAMLARVAALRGGRVGDVQTLPMSDSVRAGDDATSVYWMPEDCLDAAQARSVGIRSEDDFFGGVVPHAFVAGKAIAHPLLAADAARPTGWNMAFGERLDMLTLPGFAEFARVDADAAVARLLRGGAVRIKRVLGIGGRGQWVARSHAEAAAALDAIATSELQTHGVVIERQLDTIETFSIGSARIGPHRVCYHGTQRLVRGRDGVEVYGGSTLHLRRGGLDDLLAAALPPAVSKAVCLTLAFDRAVAAAYPGFIASRRNYDVACGQDEDGRAYCGVLEQSWRFGGASPGEILAMELFAADPARTAVTVSTHECHAPRTPPPGAIVYWNDPDEAVGPLLKYALVHDADTP